MQPIDQYNQLAFYTLSHKGPNFIHQHVVDAFAIQNANENTKPITIIYALVGIYLHVEKNYTGKEVQMAHVKMTKKSKVFPHINLPSNRGAIKINDILAITAPTQRDAKIHQWCVCIWEALYDQQDSIIKLANELL